MSVLLRLQMQPWLHTFPRQNFVRTDSSSSFIFPIPTRSAWCGPHMSVLPPCYKDSASKNTRDYTGSLVVHKRRRPQKNLLPYLNGDVSKANASSVLCFFFAVKILAKEIFQRDSTLITAVLRFSSTTSLYTQSCFLPMEKSSCVYRIPRWKLFRFQFALAVHSTHIKSASAFILFQSFLP